MHPQIWLKGEVFYNLTNNNKYGFHKRMYYELCMYCI